MHFSVTFYVVLIAILLSVVIGASILKTLLKSSKKAGNYVLKGSLVTPAERSFLGCLESVVSPDIRVFVKVRLADLFEVERNLDRSMRQSAFNKINSKHIDFVLCRADDLFPILAIELDDKTHEREDRRKRDGFLDEMFAASTLPLIRFKVQRTYQSEAIAQRLNEAMS